MLDFVLGAVFVLLAVRGWMRGFVREVIGLGVLVIGLIVAFRLSTPLGAVIESMVGTSPDVSRFVAGVILMLTISITAGIVAHVLHAGLRMMPGLTTLNRVGGSAVSMLAGAVVVFVIVSLVALLPVPSEADDTLEESAIAAYVTDPESVPQVIIGMIAGDRVIASVLALQDLFGERRLVAPPAGAIPFPAAAADETKPVDRPTDKLFDLLNRERAGADAAPLQRSEVLDELALEYALSMYATGTLRRDLDVAGTLSTQGIPVSSSGMVAAIAASPKSVHEALELDAASLAEMVERNHLTVGIAVVKGPLGLLAVEVFTG